MLARALSGGHQGTVAGGRRGGAARKGGVGGVDVGRERSSAARSLVAFALRLDVIVVSAACLVVLAVLLVVLACLA